MMSEADARSYKIILDTDIADDIDDAIALSFVLGSPEFDLLGVTVVYGYVETRARVARKLLRAWGRHDIPVVPGCTRPLGFEYHPGTAPETCSQSEAVAGEAEPIDYSRTAAGFIRHAANLYPGQVYVVTIGAMTNVAVALCQDPWLVDGLAGVISLAGYVPPRLSQPEWNVRYDPLAAQTIARSGVDWTVIGADVQGGNGLTSDEFRLLEVSGLPSAKLLLDLIVLMKRHKGHGDGGVLGIEQVDRVHVADVFAPASLLIPEQMDLRRGCVRVADDGALQFAPDEHGSHWLAHASVPEGRYRREILRRLLAGPV